MRIETSSLMSTTTSMTTVKPAIFLVAYLRNMKVLTENEIRQVLKYADTEDTGSNALGTQRA